MEERTQEYEKQLQESLEALTYLEDRGITNGDLVSQLRIGFVADPLPGDGRFRGSISIPYLQPAGITWMKFRRLEGQPKYDAVSGISSRIYNTTILRTARKLVITEGEIDTISCLQAGLQAVGVPGANGWKKEWGRIFRNRDVTVLCDGDEAGRKLGDTLTNALWDARIVECPQGEDPNSLLLTKGPEFLRRMVLGQ